MGRPVHVIARARYLARLTRTVEDPLVGLSSVFFLFTHCLIAKERLGRIKVVYDFGLVIDSSQKVRRGSIDAVVILGKFDVARLQIQSMPHSYVSYEAPPLGNHYPS